MRCDGSDLEVRMIHERLDIARWKRMFPLASLRERAEQMVREWQARDPNRYQTAEEVREAILLVGPGGERITGPIHIAVVEQLRDEAQIPQSITRIPTDLFVFARGEPQNRATTKIGGLPYWPSSRPWPHNIIDEPLTFVGQFCFADSHDIAANLPGDVVVIFGDQQAVWNHDESGLLFEWLPLGMADLISEEQIPPTRWRIEPCFGAIHRTYDAPDSQTYFLLDIDDEEKFDRAEQVAVLEGTKIGGVPRWIQSPEELPGRFLCALGSIQPEADSPYPWLNVQAPVERRGYASDPDYLMWGDVGSVYMFIDTDGGIHWTEQCY